MKTEYILECVAEECAEVIQAITKILRFGLDDIYNGISNKRQLINEIADLLAVIDMLDEKIDIAADGKTYVNVAELMEEKKNRVREWHGKYACNIKK